MSASNPMRLGDLRERIRLLYLRRGTVRKADPVLDPSVIVMFDRDGRRIGRVGECMYDREAGELELYAVKYEIEETG